MLDLGGIHPAISGGVAVDNIPYLVKNVVYPFDFFYCERHSVASCMSLSSLLLSSFFLTIYLLT